LNADSLEKERQKNAQLIITSVRDKLTSRRRNEDSLGLEFDRCYRNKRKPDQTLLDKPTAIENEIASLEQKLDELHGDEYRRHSDMINQQSLELAASSSDAATILRSSSSDRNNESSADSVNSSPRVHVHVGGDDVDDVVAMIPMHQVNNNTNNGCVECSSPSNHSCRKCRKCVCSLCCGARALENAWCCATIFEA
jgi:hypothetical protein